MLSFKHWLTEINKIDFDDDMDTAEDDNPDVVFGRRDKNEKIEPREILAALGLPGDKLEYHDKGSFAIVYKHPTDKNLLIKVTADAKDAANLVKAQKLNNRCIVRVHKSAKVREHAFALIVDFVKGPPMVYGSSGLFSLINGDRWQDAKDAVKGILNPDRTRRKTLDHFKKNNPQELTKLSELFAALVKLERLSIDIHDFGDNIHDAGDHYVIIDLGL